MNTRKSIYEPATLIIDDGQVVHSKQNGALSLKQLYELFQSGEVDEIQLAYAVNMRGHKIYNTFKGIERVELCSVNEKFYTIQSERYNTVRLTDPFINLPITYEEEVENMNIIEGGRFKKASLSKIVLIESIEDEELLPCTHYAYKLITKNPKRSKNLMFIYGNIQVYA